MESYAKDAIEVLKGQGAMMARVLPQNLIRYGTILRRPNGDNICSVNGDFVRVKRETAGNASEGVFIGSDMGCI